jgi:hypothetical protein
MQLAPSMHTIALKSQTGSFSPLVPKSQTEYNHASHPFYVEWGKNPPDELIWASSQQEAV